MMTTHAVRAQLCTLHTAKDHHITASVHAILSASATQDARLDCFFQDLFPTIKKIFVELVSFFMISKVDEACPSKGPSDMHRIYVEFHCSALVYHVLSV